MKVQVSKEFKFAPDGNNVVTVAVGALVDGRCAEVALKNGWGSELAEAPAVEAPPAPPPPPPVEVAPDPVPHVVAEPPPAPVLHAEAPKGKKKGR